MDFYEERKKQILTQDDYKCEEYTISLPIFLFREIKECDTFVKAFYGSPIYVMKEMDGEWIDVKPKTTIKFLKSDKGRYWYRIKQERVLPTKEK